MQTKQSRKAILIWAILTGIITDLVILGYPFLLSYFLKIPQDVTPLRFTLLIYGWGGTAAGVSLLNSAIRNQDASFQKIALLLILTGIYTLGLLAGSLMHGLFGID